MNIKGPEYTKPWDRAAKTAPTRICKWIAEILAEEKVAAQ